MEIYILKKIDLMEKEIFLEGWEVHIRLKSTLSSLPTYFVSLFATPE